MLTLKINKNDAGQRADKFLTKSLNAVPSSLLYKYLRLKKIKCNRKRLKPNDILREGDIIDLYIPEEFFPDFKSEKEPFMRLKPHIDVIYEDGNMLLVNKKPGMACIPDKNEDTNTLINHIKAYLYRKGEYDPKDENSFAPALCNRIDRNTSGIVIGAKNAKALRHLNSEIKNRTVNKRYLCAVHGIPDKKQEVLEGWLIKDCDSNMVSVYTEKPASNRAKKIKTGYKVIDTNTKLNISLLEIELFTGRTHQIRAHMSAIGYPLYGDGKYGINKEERRKGYKYQALCAYSVTIDGKTYSIPKSDIWFINDLFGLKD